jgi:hypothetical protein
MVGINTRANVNAKCAAPWCNDPSIPSTPSWTARFRSVALANTTRRCALGAHVHERAFAARYKHEHAKDRAHCRCTSDGRDGAFSPQNQPTCGRAALCCSARTFGKLLNSKAHRLFFAGVAQLVERQLPKLDVAGSNPVSRLARIQSETGILSRVPVLHSGHAEWRKRGRTGSRGVRC